MRFTAAIYRNIGSPQNCHYDALHNPPFKIQHGNEGIRLETHQGKCCSTTKGSGEETD